MRLNLDATRYLLAVSAALHAGVALPTTMDCPECVEEVDWLDPDGHQVVEYPGPDGSRFALAIGCEGYWVIDPCLLGFTASLWMPVTEPKDAPLVDPEQITYEVPAGQPTATCMDLLRVLVALPPQRPVTILQPDGAWWLNVSGAHNNPDDECSLIVETRDDFDTRQF
jgi:hypothetical protein